MTDIYGGDLSSTRYSPGTAAWGEALESDLSFGRLTQAQYDWALQNPGMAIPTQVGTTAESSGGWGSFLGTLTSTADVLFTGIAKARTMDYERDLLQTDIERRRRQLETGLPTPQGFGGLNAWTLIGLAVVVLFAMLLLKKP